MLQDYYKRYWIKAGVGVHWNMDLANDVPRTMYVDYLIKKGVSLNGDSSKKHVMVVGVRCHWVSDGGVYQVGRFNVNELVPVEIYKGGNSELLKWSEFMNGGFNGKR